MKPYARQCGGSPPPLSTQSHAGRNNLGMDGEMPTGEAIVDKTQHCESRPGAKEKIRNAKRAWKKRARQQLKQEMLNGNEIDLCRDPEHDTINAERAESKILRAAWIEKDNEVQRLRREVRLLAILAAKTPQFFNPLVAMEAETICDRILTELPKE